MVPKKPKKEEPIFELKVELADNDRDAILLRIFKNEVVEDVD